MDTKEQIKELNKVLDEAVIQIDSLTKELNILKNKSSISEENFWDKEKELSKLKESLDACQIEEINIQKEIEKHVEELNHSNLSKEEKNQKLVEIMTGDSQQLKVSRQKLNQVWKNFGQNRDILLEVEKNLSNSRLKSIESLEKTKHNLWITVWALIGIVVLLSLSLSLLLQKKHKKKIK